MGTEGEIRVCEYCKKEFILSDWKIRFIKKHNKINWGKFCSKSCKIKNDNRFWKKGHIPWSKGKKGVTLNTGKTHFKKGFTPWNKGKKLPQFSKENHPNWKGGIYNTVSKIRKSYEYKLWRKAVLERDKYKCIWCNSIKNLEVDHIKPFILFPELRYAIDNGRVLCHSCHQKTSTYGNKKIYE